MVCLRWDALEDLAENVWSDLTQESEGPGPMVSTSHMFFWMGYLVCAQASIADLTLFSTFQLF